MKREINTRETGIFEFVDGLEKHRYLIPSFQRNFVWEPCDIIRLWESIYNFYPIGGILCWETDVKLNIHRRPGGAIFDGAPEKENSGYVYILDGQQRATSLFLSIVGGRLKDRDNFDHRLFFDSKNGGFFFADEYKRRAREVDSILLIPLEDLVNKSSLSIEMILNKNQYTVDIRENLLKLEYAINNYMIPLTFIRGFDIPSVSKIYELINREGKALDSMDIMIARTFRNYEYLVEEDL